MEDYLDASMNNKDFVKIIKDAYGVFIDNGGSPDSYLSPDIYYRPLNDTIIFNGTINNNESITYISSFNDIIDKNDSASMKNATYEDDVTQLVVAAVTSIVLGLMILITVIGNIFVIAAIVLERNLQTVANYLVASLAVADLLVACLVMPLGAVYVISRGWILGPELCDIWTSCDVLCCTASILHLVAIAADRYWAVTNVDYIHSRTPRRVFVMISLIWTSSVIVSLAPQFGWKDPGYMERIEQEKCMVSQDVGYQIFATCSTFYVPLLMILFLYWKIYQTARKRIHRRRPKPILSTSNQIVLPIKPNRPFQVRLISKKQDKSNMPTLGMVEGYSTITDDSSSDRRGIDMPTATFANSTTEGATTSSSDMILTVSQQVACSQSINEDEESETNLEITKLPPPRIVNASLAPPSPLVQQMGTKQEYSRMLQHQESDIIRIEESPTLGQRNDTLPEPTAKLRKTKSRKETLETKRERKAAKTLAIITGAFVVCWLPFFIMALLLPLCGEICSISDEVAALFLWLGYFNSTLNPVIYTIFSPEFRQIFKRMLCGAPSRGIGYGRGNISSKGKKIKSPSVKYS